VTKNPRKVQVRLCLVMTWGKIGRRGWEVGASEEGTSHACEPLPRVALLGPSRLYVSPAVTFVTVRYRYACGRVVIGRVATYTQVGHYSNDKLSTWTPLLFTSQVYSHFSQCLSLYPWTRQSLSSVQVPGESLRLCI
jgi:hypothetical protein